MYIFGSEGKTSPRNDITAIYRLETSLLLLYPVLMNHMQQSTMHRLCERHTAPSKKNNKKTVDIF